MKWSKETQENVVHAFLDKLVKMDVPLNLGEDCTVLAKAALAAVAECSEIKALVEALEVLRIMGLVGMEPNPTKWIAFHDEVARIATEALTPFLEASNG